MVPTPFGRYLLVERLAAGGLGDTYRGIFDGGDGERGALVTTIRAELATPTVRAAFAGEAARGASLAHVNLLRPLAWGEEDGVPFLASEPVEAVELGRLGAGARRQGAALGLGEVLFLGAEVARALAFLHRDESAGKGLVHRGVSPRTILVGAGGEVRLAELPLCRAILPHWRELLPRSPEALLDRLRYFAPEQINGEPLDGRSDLFSLGALLYELLTGRPPCDAATVDGLVAQVRRGEFPPPSRLGRGVPRSLDLLVAALLDGDREARPRGAEEVRIALTALLDEAAPGFRRSQLATAVERLLPAASRAPLTLDGLDRKAARRPSPGPGGGPGIAPPAVDQRGGAPPPAAPRRRRWPAAVGGALIALGVAAGTTLVRPARQADPPRRAQLALPPAAGAGPRPPTVAAPPTPSAPRPARPDQAVVDGGARFRVTGARHDPTTSTLSLGLEITNPGAAAIATDLGSLRLRHQAALPDLDLDLPTLPPNRVRELTVRFAPVAADAARGAVLRLPQGGELPLSLEASR